MIQLLNKFLLVSQISFDDRKLCKDQDTHLFVDCIDCRIRQKGPLFASHKFKGKSGLQYKIATGLLSGEVKWINGPYPCGKWLDLTIFWYSLQAYLHPEERVEEDDGYYGKVSWTC